MTFSIIVPIFNSERYLTQCINSIISQSYKAFNLILVDDGSEDNSLKICNDFASKDDRIIVVHKENGGSTSARKAACSYAKNEYVVCVDSDDYLESNFLETVNANLTREIDILCVGYQNEKGTKLYKNALLGVCDSTYVLKDFMYDEKRGFPNDGNLLYGLCSKIIRRDIFVGCQLSVSDKAVMGEDLLCSALCIAKSKAIKVIDYYGYFYRTNESSMTRSFNPKKVYQFIDVCDELIKVFKDEPNKVYCFALYNLLNLQSSFARNNSNYSAFLACMESVKFCRGLKKYSSLASVHRCSLKWKLKIFLDRHDLYRLMYFLYK